MQIQTTTGSKVFLLSKSVVVMQNQLPDFSKSLFWDINQSTLDADKNARFIVERVITRGRLSDWRKLFSFYGMERIKNEVLQVRYLDQLTLNFCSSFFNVPKSEFRCYNQPQSIQALWTF